MTQSQGFEDLKQIQHERNKGAALQGKQKFQTDGPAQRTIWGRRLEMLVQLSVTMAQAANSAQTKAEG